MASEWKHHLTSFLFSEYKHIKYDFLTITIIHYTSWVPNVYYELRFGKADVGFYELKPEDECSLDQALEVLSDSIKNAIHVAENTSFAVWPDGRNSDYCRCLICEEDFGSNRIAHEKCYNHIMGHASMTKSAIKQ